MLASRAAKLGFPTIDRVFDRYSALAHSAEGLGGTLLLYSGLDAEGIAAAVASNVAGAASLGLEENAERAKQALRAGVCDFVVNNLDEALRILKNELRKHTVVSVCLIDKHKVAVKEAIERGVQPQIVAFPEPTLQERGARLLDATGRSEPVQMRWSVESEGPQWLPVLDKLAVAATAREELRARWIESAPRYLGRAFAGQRYVRMAEAEADAFVIAVRAAVGGGAVPVPVVVERGDETVRIEN